jgi:hypothetical protein
MKNEISDIKFQIKQARESGDIDKELDLSDQLTELRSKQRIKTIEEAYAQLADSP